MIKKIHVVLLLYSIQNLSFGQDLNLISRGNLGIGTAFHSIDYNGGDMLYSAGGGLGIEVGVQYEVIKNLMIQPTLGFQLNLAFQAESVNGISNKSSFNFNRKFLALEVLKKIDLTEKTLNGFLIGSGFNYNFPGRLKRIENDENLGTSRYDANTGFYFELGLRLKLDKSLYLDPTIRYRQLDFKANSFTQGTVSDLPENLQKLNANGIELGLTIVKKLNTGKR